MSGLDHLRAISSGTRPADDGLLGNTRCAWGGSEHLSEEAILAAFTSQPLDLTEELVAVETAQGAALIVEGQALVADLYDRRIGRMWRVGSGNVQPTSQAVDVAFDPDLRQERGDVSFRAEDHPELDSVAAEHLLSAVRDLVEEERRSGKLRVRGFVVRAFGTLEGAAALIALFTLGNEESRSAAFSYAVLSVGAGGKIQIVRDDTQAREWTPRL